MNMGPGQLDSRIEIITPENIAFQYRVAGPFRRLPAYAIDLIVRGLICWGALMLLGFASTAIEMRGLGIGLTLMIWFVMSWFYGGLFEAYWNGQTPGKRTTGIRVLSIDGQPINAMQAILRNILRAADALPVLQVPGSWIGFQEGVMLPMPLYLVGLITPMFTSRYQRLGDMACGTMVVIEERQYRVGIVAMKEPEAIRVAGLLPANLKVSRNLARAVSKYVERRAAFSIERRAEIARRLGETICEHYGLDRSMNYDRLLCALYYRAFINDSGEADPSSQPGMSPPAKPARAPTAELISR